MTDPRSTRNINLDNIQRTLERCLGAGNFPLPMVGDLDDLLFTLDPVVEILRRLTSDESGAYDREMLLADLCRLEYILTDELALILNDLRPELRAIGVTSLEDPTPSWRAVVQKFLDYWRRPGKWGEK